MRCGISSFSDAILRDAHEIIVRELKSNYPALTDGQRSTSADNPSGSAARNLVSSTTTASAPTSSTAANPRPRGDMFTLATDVSNLFRRTEETIRYSSKTSELIKQLDEVNEPEKRAAIKAELIPILERKHNDITEYSQTANSLKERVLYYLTNSLLDQQARDSIEPLVDALILMSTRFAEASANSSRLISSIKEN